MKTLNINLNSLLVSVFMLMAMFLVGCEKDTETPVAPIFPELTDIPCSAGETKEITFEANMDWTLTIKGGTVWCQFVNGEIAESTISGKSGKQTVKVSISDLELNYEKNDVATIVMEMGGETKDVFTVTRAKKEYQDLTVKDADGNIYDAQHPLVIKGDGITENLYDIVYTTVIASADMTVGITKMPEWVTVEQSENGQFNFRFKRNNTTGVNYLNTYSNEGDVIRFATQDAIDGNVQTDKVRVVEIPVSYEGLRDYAIDFSLTDPEQPNFIGANLFLEFDSQMYKTKIVSDDGNTSYGTLLSCVVNVVRNSKFVPVIIGMNKITNPNGSFIYEYNFDFDLEENQWVSKTVTDNKVDLDFFINPYGIKPKEDSGIMVLLFSEDFYENNKQNLKDALLDEEGFLKQEYNNNIMVSLLFRDNSLRFKGFYKENGSSEMKSFEELGDKVMIENQWGNFMISMDYQFLSKGSFYIEVAGYNPETMQQMFDGSLGKNVTCEFKEEDGKYYYVISGAATSSDCDSSMGNIYINSETQSLSAMVTLFDYDAANQGNDN
ncbi:hypothetical protein H6A66_15250 [Bacteroides caecigallinarum]|uniref:hypothetical protein n=1 Tax=Bacteroides caecigallinarum TaxID=1411144 RepID=UPI001958A291|nr:hypothetical protein [Bacteroides caecigallinarum]MBM6866506.1 hypothetical protein [Bacteroides caecigallinarum]